MTTIKIIVGFYFMLNFNMLLSYVQYIFLFLNRRDKCHGLKLPFLAYKPFLLLYIAVLYIVLISTEHTHTHTQSI